MTGGFRSFGRGDSHAGSATATGLRASAEQAAAGLPALMLAAERLAAGVVPGAHGQRRPGAGDEFWQYRAAAPGELAGAVDWRRSARSDAQFVRENEAMTARSAVIWIASGAGMDWRADENRPTKRERAAVLALALGLVLLRGGERVAALGQAPGSGRAAADRLAMALLVDQGAGGPDMDRLQPGQRVVVISDFMTPLSEWQAGFARAAALGVRGVALQLLDPAEESFPFEGALRLYAPGGGHAFETHNAAALAPAYRARLAEHRAALAQAAAKAGWIFGHDTTASAPALTLGWAYAALAG